MKAHYFLSILFLVGMTSCNRNCSAEALEKRFALKNDLLVSGSSQELKGLVLPKLQYTHSNCWTEHMDEFLSKPEVKGLFYKSIVVDSVAYHVTERTGLVRGNGTFNINHKGNDLSIHLCFTETYVCQDGQWMLFARHAAKL